MKTRCMHPVQAAVPEAALEKVIHIIELSAHVRCHHMSRAAMFGRCRLVQERLPICLPRDCSCSSASEVAPRTKSIVMQADDAARCVINVTAAVVYTQRSLLCGTTGQWGAGAAAASFHAHVTGRFECRAGASRLAGLAGGSFFMLRRRSHGRRRGRDAPVQRGERHDDRRAGLGGQDRVEAQALWPHRAGSVSPTM